MKKILPLLAGTLLLVSTHLSAQKASEVISSVPLPAELADFHSWQPGMTQCDADGNLMVLSPARDQLLKVGLNGGIVLRIAVSGIAGLGELEVRSFASAPNGELYVMANQVFHKEVKADADSPTVRTVRRSGYFMFLRFDTHGELIANKRFEQRYVIPWMAVFDSGEFLMIEWRKRPVARLYSADLALLKEVDLAKTALAGHQGNHEILSIAAGDRAFVLGQWWNRSDNLRAAAIATISRSGDILGSAVVKLPTGYSGRELRRRGDHLFGGLVIEAKDDPHAAGDLLELDPQSGEIVARFKRSREESLLGCETPDGMSFLNLHDHKLEVIALRP